MLPSSYRFGMEIFYPFSEIRFFDQYDLKRAFDPPHNKKINGS